MTLPLTQRVLLLRKFGGPEGFAVVESPMPVPGPGEVLVKVLAASVQFTDVILRQGRYPDQLGPPSQPTDLGFGVARLTLRPGPCRTGDAVIQLAMPLDGSNALEVVTYNAKGELIGQYGAFQPLPSPKP